ncbi:hypothetical protein RchiOBHm_Chr7g0195381 [Rosa chinensis]|uniref:Uncharacterized protein n=1 Tax=Rosa chinensis TaxID=74649 RepID=A0A2P6P6B0_ROSCH|nr:hypothetical protein RchiOBHm_Chr7g0195381 [Rosa chinensis]
MKEEYSWTKLHSLLFSSAQPLLFDGDRGRVLLKVELSNGGARLEWFTLKTGEMTKIDGCCTLPGSGVHVCEGNIRLLLDGHPDGKHGYLW